MGVYMKRKYKLFILSLVFISLIGIYFYTDTLNLANKLSYSNTKIYAHIEQIVLENTIMGRAELSDEIVIPLLQLIQKPMYYKFHAESYLGDTSLINLTIINNTDFPKVHYEFFISDTGIIYIKDLYDNKKDSSYSLKPFYKFIYPIFSTSKDAEIELYNQIYNLIYLK